MAGEVAQSPPQVNKDGRWRPIRQNTAPSFRSYPPELIPPRRSSLRALQSRLPLAPIQEYKTASVTSRSTDSLEDQVPTYLPTSWMSSSECLVVIPESPQLQQLQSVSLSFVDDPWKSEPAQLYQTQSHWSRLAPAIYLQSGIPNWEGSTSREVQYTYSPESRPSLDTATTYAFEERKSWEIEAEFMRAEQRLPREEIAEFFYRAEEYDREHPEFVSESGKVWVRVNSVSHGLTKTLKTMGSLRMKKSSFEARLGPNVPVYSRLKCYEKPTRVKRMRIVAQDCWRKFRNWSTGRDTALQAKRFIPTAHPTIGVSVVSLDLTPGCEARPSMGHRRLSRTPNPEGWEPMAYLGHARKDSKNSTYEESVKRRRSSLFLDIYSADGPVAG